MPSFGELQNLLRSSRLLQITRSTEQPLHDKSLRTFDLGSQGFEPAIFLPNPIRDVDHRRIPLLNAGRDASVRSSHVLGLCIVNRM